MTTAEEQLLFTIAKILRRRLVLETDDEALQELRRLDDAIEEVRFQEVPS